MPTLKSVQEQVARNLTASGYGVNYERALEIMSKLDAKDLDDLMYLCYRTAEKRGRDHFSCDEPSDDE